MGETATARRAGPAVAVTSPGPAPRRRVLGALLLERGEVTAAQLATALEEQQRTRERVGRILARYGVDPGCIARALATQLRLDFAPPPLIPDPGAAELVDRDLATRLRAVPLELRDRVLRVAMADPLNLAAIDDLQFRTGRRVEVLVAEPGAVDAGLAAAYASEEVAALLARLRTEDDGDARSHDVGVLRRASEAPPIVALVQHLLERAHGARASDLHVEPGAGGLQVRARIDGALRQLVRLPGHLGAAMVSRVKIMAGLDIAMKRVPQDGRCALRLAGEDVVARVSTLPCVGGEKVVLRLLRGGRREPRLDELGLGDADRARLDALLLRSHGVILVTGPTGSGKTTTLYAALAALDREHRNIVTLEEPVEYRLPGVTQVQVQRRAGVGFASGLRAVLRQDPDVIMVGEMRDRETVEVGLAAALTGHLVLSTLHTNDAASAVTRLLEMGAPPYLIAGALIGVVAQRLVRRRCPDCGGPGTGPGAALRSGDSLDAGASRGPRTGAHTGAGGDVASRCGTCDGSGFHGRIGVFEVLAVSAAIRDLILGSAGAGHIRTTAVREGMRLLGEDARAKVGGGLTTAEEVRPLIASVGAERRCGCGATLRRSYVRCPECGKRLAARCSCGARLQQGWRWCPACGGDAPAGRRG
jgi:type IV pilus assembly protein PilB